MKIYIASSWKNKEKVRELANDLIDRGHEVYDFTHPDNFVEGVDGPQEHIPWVDHCERLEVLQSCLNDLKGIRWADALILLLPAGNSAHFEAGIAWGVNKKVIIYGDLPPGNFECIYAATPHRFGPGDYEDMMELLEESH